jgi:hypothetical protein
MNHESTPATPSAGTVKVYPKSDNSLYVLDPNGVETQVGSGSGQGEKNYITNPSMKSATTGWNNVGDLDVARTTTASELPREYSTAAGIKITADANTQSTADYVYFDFTLDDVDLNKKLKIEWSQKLFGAYTAGQLAVVITTQADRTTALHTPVTTAIPAADGVFTTSFDSGSTATLSLVIRATTDMTTDTGIVISDVVVGPGTITQGAAVGTPVDATFTGTWVTNTTYTAKETRVGSWAHYTVRVLLSGAPTSATLTLTMPSGRTIDTTALANSSAVASNALPGQKVTILDSGTATYDGMISLSSSTTMLITYLDANAVYQGVTQAAPVTFASGDTINISFQVPIAEWAGNGTVNLGAGAQVEYASCAITSDADNSTTIYGPAGSLFPTVPLSVPRIATVTWQTPRQESDVFFLEIASSSTAGWLPVEANQAGSFAYITQNGVEYGAYLSHTSSTTTRVLFNRYAIPTGATYGAAGSNWSAATNYRWRLRKVSPSSPVGFGLATQTASGLISAEYASAEGDLGTITIGAGTWTTIDSKKYRWVRNGKQVTLWYRLESTTAAVTLTTFNFELPSDCPTPSLFSTAGTSEWTGFSGLGITSTGVAAAEVAATGSLYRGAGGAFTIYHTQPSTASKIVFGSVTYLTA